MDRPASRRQRGERPAALTICGSGNAGHALAVVASQHFDGAVDWLVGSEEKAELLHRHGSTKGLRSTGVIEGRADRLRTISSDPAEVIPEADLVIVAVPAYAHAAVLRSIAPHLSESTSVGCLPARGGFEFEASQLLSKRHASGGPTIFGLQTLPWSTRVVTAGEVVNFGAKKAEVLMAAIPAADGALLARRLSTILGTKLVSAGAFLSLTLGNPGQFIHPGLMYGHFGRWGGEELDRIPMFFADATDEVARPVEELSQDALAVARAIGEQSNGAVDVSGVVPVHRWLQSAYAHVTGDSTTVARCFSTGPIQVRKAPMIEVGSGRFVPNFEYRYLSEDVPYGLVVTRSIAELANVPTPAIDEVIEWAQSHLKTSYLVDGRVAGPDAEGLPTPQNNGISTLDELIGWYEDDRGKRLGTGESPAAGPQLRS